MRAERQALRWSSTVSWGWGFPLLAAACSAPDATREQTREPVSIDLPPAELTFTEQQFTKIRYPVRELEDGRLLVSDIGENSLYVVDFQSGRVAKVGTIGEGPGEYQWPGHLFALGGDSTLFTANDASGGHRWLIMVGDSFVETTNPPEPIFRRLYGTGEELLGVDRSGRVLGLEGFAFRPEVSGISHADADSLRFLLTPGSVFGAEGRTSAGEFDTIAEVGGRSRLGVKINRDEMIFEGQRMHTNSRTKSPLASEGEAWLFPDGWIAVAHPDPYRVDWRRPDGRWIRGAPLSFTPVKVDEGEKCFAAARRGSDACDLDRYPGWPENVPAFQMDTDPWRRIGPNGIVLRAAPNGMLLINRTASAAFQENRFDVVDRSGGLRGTIRVPDDRTIVGSGRSSLYVVEKDDMDLLTLSRHPWPDELGDG